MKTTFTIIVVMLILGHISFSQVPVLWGMSNGGGTSHKGVIFKINGDGTGYTIIHNCDTSGYYPRGNLIKGIDGKLYGLTYYGGIRNVQNSYNGYGTIFNIDPSNNIYTVLFRYTGTNGWSPNGSLIQALDGKLYGLTTQGGIHDYGVIFSFDPNSNIYSDLFDFNGTTSGGNPYGSLIQDTTDYKFYGMTFYGGILNPPVGIIFNFDATTNTLGRLHDFDDTIAANPKGSILKANNGRFYGMTSGSGAIAGTGNIFDFVNTNYYNIHHCDTINGKTPYGSLMQANNNLLYGMTESGGSYGDGVIFKIDPSNNSYTKLLDFYGTNGSLPFGSLMQASDGKLYGMTSSGGANYGTIFSFNPANNIITNLFNFDNNNGGGPFGDLIEVPNVTTSINQEIEQISLLSIYPNPFSDKATICIEGELKDKKTVLNIYNLLGQEVKSIFIGSNNEIVLNRDNLQRGMYFYKLIDNTSNSISNGKFIIE